EENVNPECTIDSDCTDTSKPICENGVCVEENVNPECTIDSDCTDTSKPICENGVCVEENINPECTGLSVPQNAFVFDSRYGYVAELNESQALVVGFYSDETVGTYDLASEINSNYETCEQCVVLYNFIDESNAQTYFQSEGGISVLEGDPTTAQSSAEIVSTKLIEVTIDDDNISTPVQNGGCYQIETASWDTMPQIECTTDSDCLDPAKPICLQNTCIANQECTGLSIPEIVTNPQYSGAYLATIDENLTLYIDFYSSSPVGSYDLSTAENSNNSTCNQCVLLQDSGLSSYYFQTEGTLNITAGDGETNQSAGDIVSVVLREVTIDGQGYSTLVGDGGCYEIETAVWDTLDSAECEVDEDCEAGFICDFGACVEEPTECEVDEDCQAGFVCDFGACVEEPTECEIDEDCQAGFVCMFGYCAEEVAECEVDEDCQAGFVCDFGACVEEATECEVDEDCEDGFVCMFGYCTEDVTPCETDEDCDAGFSCIDNICEGQNICEDDLIGNTAETATAITLPYTGNHVICGDAADVFSVNLTAGDILNVVLNNFGENDFDLYLYDENGEEISSSESSAPSENIISSIEATGLYYVIILPYRGEGNYSLSVAFFESECEVDADCLDSTKPICDSSVGVCIADLSEWSCDSDYYGDGVCDCGCGIIDVDCSSNSSNVCIYDNCPDETLLSETENWLCE
ncbi:PPC domain-containing protein, partial [bacterium]|nr:PPC domain-containing protein [bacterium]